DRFDISKYQSGMPFAKMAQSMVKSMMGDYFKNYVTWLVRSFIRCLLNASEAIYLKDMAALIQAEAGYMTGIGPFGLFNSRFGQSTGSDRSSGEAMTEGEVHAWMIHLTENDKLPGRYERFTGRYLPS
ncbi:MAG: hypothetical protein KGD64_04465, partial [Candidatus Heimdallarchaeota archaeon]|nr:hypothetical protein [Candidatus Heimdallarchaeota archaeon]